MLIDWFTIIAQVVNFLILVWLMKRFLYAPILDALDAREGQIAARLADARITQEEAQRRRDEYREKNEEFERQRKALLSAATLAAQAERRRLFEEARKAHEVLLERQRQAMRSDFLNQKDEIMRRTREEVFAITRKTLADLAGESLEKQMIEAFIRRCRKLAEEERSELQPAFDAANEPALVRSTFSLPAELQRDLEQAVREIFAFQGSFLFETSPDGVSGIVLNVNGYEVAWSIAEYLPVLEQSVAELLSVRSTAEKAMALDSGNAGPENRSKSVIMNGK